MFLSSKDCRLCCCKNLTSISWLSKGVFALASALPIIATCTAANAQLRPSDFETPEYYSNAGLQWTFASEAYALGFTGKGVKIGIADTAMQWSHIELVKRFDWPKPRPAFPAVGYETASYPDHGTHVAGIAAAERDGWEMMGVAFDGSIASAVVVSWHENDGYPANPDWAQSLIDAEVSIMNGSFGLKAAPKSGRPQVDFQFVNYQGTLDSYNAASRLASEDIVMIFSNGNNFDDQPGASTVPASMGLLPLITPENTSKGYPFTSPTAPTNALYRLFNDNADDQDTST